MAIICLPSTHPEGAVGNGLTHDRSLGPRLYCCRSLICRGPLPTWEPSVRLAMGLAGRADLAILYWPVLALCARLWRPPFADIRP